MGPGTHILERIGKGIKPTSYADALALRHDLHYIFGMSPVQADLVAISDASKKLSLDSLAMILGLSTRSLIDTIGHLGGAELLHFNKRSDNLSLSNDDLKKLIIPRANNLMKPFGIQY